VGGKKRMVAALAAEAEVGSWERATMTAGDGTTAQRMPPRRVPRGGSAPAPHHRRPRQPRHKNQTAHGREREEEDGGDNRLWLRHRGWRRRKNAILFLNPVEIIKGGGGEKGAL